MIYKAHQIAYWPRLLHAATDPGLKAALQELMEQGASLTVTDQGAFKIEPGKMTQEAYSEFRAAKLAPRAGQMTRALVQARDKPHPWGTAALTAYNDLNKRCTMGKAKLAEAHQQKDTALVTVIVATLMVRHIQASALAQGLYYGGYDAYLDHTSNHTAAWMDLWPVAGALGLQVRHSEPWPIQTPDGWLWVTEAALPSGVTPEPVDLGGAIGLKAWSPDEPIVTDQALGRGLAAVGAEIWGP